MVKKRVLRGCFSGWMIKSSAMILCSIMLCSGFNPMSWGNSLGTAKSHSPTLLSIELFPEKVLFQEPEALQRFVVVGKFSDGLDRDVTQHCHFQLTNSKVASIIEGAQIRGLSQGKTLLQVTIDRHVAEVPIQILKPKSKQARISTFTKDLGPIFTKHGCNSSGCHGGVKGQGGFKLSLNSLYPEDDYQWVKEGGTFKVLTAESDEVKNPRIDLKNPENSLILLKPTMEVVHGGGLKFSKDSSEYKTILNWIQNGAPYGDSKTQGAIRIEQVSVFPKKFVLEPKGKQQLIVMATLSNGWEEDISDQVLYVSNNPDVITVSSSGQVNAVSKGESSIMIRAAGQAVSTSVGVITEIIPNYPDIPKFNFIDDYVFSKLRRFNIIPSELSSDSEFLRRICLDLAGRLPPSKRVIEFLNSQDPQKREKIIDTLLNSPEYEEFLTFKFAQLFRVARSQNGATMEFSTAYWQWIRDNIRQNKPYDQVVIERISSQGHDGPSRHFQRVATENDPEGPKNTMTEQVRVFFGRRLDCAQCHNHPFDVWSQDQFWGLAAFFGKLNQLGWSDESDMVIFDNPEGRGFTIGQPEDIGLVKHPRTKEYVNPTFPDGVPLPHEQFTDPRQAIAKWITSHPYFAEATVNRIWNDFFGRGIVDPIDDFRSTNPPSHPELLTALASEFKSNGYDLKHLIKLIVSSRTYQLSSIPNNTNRHDTLNYSHFQVKALESEVLLDALSDVTGVSDETYMDTTRGHVAIGTRAVDLKDWDMQHSRFMELHGRYNRSGRKNESSPSLPQALHSFAGETFIQKISKKGGNLDKMLSSGLNDNAIIEEFFLMALSRFPSDDELHTLTTIVEESPTKDEILQDFVWALINTREFAYNH